MNTMQENYKFLIENEWKDIHHSRVQEWSALGVITATHIGLVQIVEQLNAIEKIVNIFPYLLTISCLLGFTFCILGILMTCRHRNLMWIKLNWIFEAEEKLGLIKSNENIDGIIPKDFKMGKNINKKELVWNKLMWPRFLSTSWLIIFFYMILALIDLGFLVYYLITH